jgi:hypothetical protein
MTSNLTAVQLAWLKGKQPKKPAAGKEDQKGLKRDQLTLASRRRDDSLKAKIFFCDDGTFSNGARAPEEEAMQSSASRGVA